MLEMGEAGSKMRAAAFADPAVSDEGVRTLTRHVANVENESQAILEGARGKLKDAEIAKQVRGDNAMSQAEAAGDALYKLRDTVQQMRAEPAEYGFTGGLNQWEKRLNAYEAAQTVRAQALSAGDMSEAEFAAKTFASLDNLKAELGNISKRKRGVAYKHHDIAAIDRLRDTYDDVLKPVLESEELWGQAGRTQATINREWEKLLQNRNRFRQAFTRDTKDVHWEEVREVDPAKIETFLANAGRARNDLDHEMLTSQLSSLAKFSRTARDVYELTPEKRAAVDRIVNAHDLAQKEIRDAVQNAALRNEAKKILETKTGRSLAELARIEAKIRGRTAAPKSPLDGLSITPSVAQQQEARDAQIRAMRQAVDTTNKQIDKSVKGFMRVIAKVPQAVREATVLRADDIAFSPDRKEDDEESSGKRHLKQLSTLINDPETLRLRLAESLGTMQTAAPRVSTEMHLQARNAVAYLAQRIPKNTYYAATPDMADKWEPSASEVRAFNRSLRAIYDPLGTVRDMENGHISKEGINALAAVYPAVHARVVNHLVPELAKAKGIPLQRRLELRDIMGVNIDPLTSPALGATIAQAYGTMAKQAAPAPRPLVSKNYRAQQSTTPLQRALEDLG